jgi:hypothetical protein
MAGRGDSMGDLVRPEEFQQFDRSGQGAAYGKKLCKKLSVAPLQRLGLFRTEFPPQLAANSTGKEAAAHPDPAMDLPTIDRQVCFGKGELPRKNVSVHCVNEGAIKIENECLHGWNGPDCCYLHSRGN